MNNENLIKMLLDDIENKVIPVPENLHIFEARFKFNNGYDVILRKLRSSKPTGGFVVLGYGNAGPDDIDEIIRTANDTDKLIDILTEIKSLPDPMVKYLYKHNGELDNENTE